MGKFCPLINKDCIEHQCKFFVHVTERHPQTGQERDIFDCTFSWLPVLLLENANRVRQTTASTDKVANQVNKMRAEVLGALPDESRERLIEREPRLDSPKQIEGNGHDGTP